MSLWQNTGFLMPKFYTAWELEKISGKNIYYIRTIVVYLTSHIVHQLRRIHVGTPVVKNVKDARIEFKTTNEVKELLSKAAILDGLDLSAFMLTCIVEKARAVLKEHATTALSEEGQRRLADILQAQPEPTEAMNEFRQLPRLKVRAK